VTTPDWIDARAGARAQDRDGASVPEDVIHLDDVRAPLVLRPGASPFRIKGIAYRGIRRFFDETVPGGADAVIGDLGAEHARFFVGRFDASAWYDSLPMVALNQAGAHRARTTFFDIVRRGARWQAQEDLKGVYRVLLKFTKPQQILARLTRLNDRYFDFGALEVTSTSATTAEAIRSGVPKSMVEFMTASAVAYTEFALAATGAHHVEITARGHELEGLKAGVELRRIRFSLSWV
jgi:hypothetical protein